MYNEFERQELESEYFAHYDRIAELKATECAGLDDYPEERVVGKLPRGYLEMGRADFEALDVPTLRAIYAAVREVAVYTMGREKFDSYVRAQGPVTPVDWIVAAMAVRCDCERCRATGTYYWGACINGVMQHSAPCARCAGKGRMTFDDMRRGRAYDNYAIVKACRG